MTMLGRFQLQKLLRQMVDAGCTYAVIETSSQGLIQHRHLGVNYDYAVFTNLTPEHIEAHGGFENYKKAKGILFEHLTSQRTKKINGKTVPKTIVANIDDPYSKYFLSFPAARKVGFTFRDLHTNEVEHLYSVTDLSLTSNGMSLTFEGTQYDSVLLGEFNAYNIAAAMCVVYEEGIAYEVLKKKLREVPTIPGRMELIDEGQDFMVIVDYAPEPESVRRVYEALKLFPKNKLIHVLGSCGGGRDVARRPVLGKLAGNTADVVVVTNEDPYDDDPMGIIFDVTEGVLATGKEEGKNLFVIADRKEAVAKAISLAKAGDIVLITGKGCELYIMAKGGKKIPHDDRDVAREALRLRLKK